MGLIVLHSGHFSKIFKALMGTSCDLKWRESNDHERLWVVAPGHPITEGLGEYIEIEHEEMYGEPFDVPPQKHLSSSAGLAAVKYSAVAAATHVGAAGFSTSAQATKPCRHTIIQRCSV